jgi:hypothetical protein
VRYALSKGFCLALQGFVTENFQKFVFFLKRGDKNKKTTRLRGFLGSVFRAAR